MADFTVWITTRDLGVGMVRRACPTCQSPILIRLPSMANAITDQQSAALRLGMTGLTTTDRTLFDAVYAFYPNAVSLDVIGAQVDMVRENLRVQAWRLRARLVEYGWQILLYHGALRLIEPAPALKETHEPPSNCDCVPIHPRPCNHRDPDSDRRAGQPEP